MAEIQKLKGVNAEGASRLKVSGVTTTDHLWACVAVDFDAGIKRLSSYAKVGENLLVATLIAESLKQTSAGGGPPGSGPMSARLRYRLPRLVLPLTLLLSVIAVSALALSLLPFRLLTLRRSVVISSRRIDPYQEVKKEDVITQPVIFRPSTYFTDLNAVVGRHTLRAIPPGEIIPEDQVTPPELSSAMRGRGVVSISVKDQPFISGLKPPTRISLLLTPRETDNKTPPMLIDDVIFISAVAKGEAVLLTVALQDIEKVSPLLPTSDIYVVQRVP